MNKYIHYLSLALFSLLITITHLSAQQAGFSYQAVAIDESKAQSFGKDSKGEILVNQKIVVRFSIRESTEDGSIVYKEVHETSTDIFGIFRAVIGRGEKELNVALESLEWGQKTYFLQVEIDLGSGFIFMGVEELFGSPYSLTKEKQQLALNNNNLSISDGNTVTLSDNDATNELITEVKLNGTRLEITDAGGTKAVDLQSLQTNKPETPTQLHDLQLVNNILTITNNAEATPIDLSPYLPTEKISEEEVDGYVNNNGYLVEETDGSITNELQTISTNGAPGNVSISNGPTIQLNVNDADADPANEIQTLSKSGIEVTLSNGGGTISVADNDNDSQNEIQDLQLTGNLLSITNNPAAAAINLSPYLGNNLTEQDVDNMVANNGYLTAEVDGSITNEIQDLSIVNNTLSITNNAAATPISLTPYLDAAFRTTSGITSNAPGNYATDDFVFGSPNLTDDGDADHASRFFFDKSSSAFRAGHSSFLAWDDFLFPRGDYSLGIGYDPISTGVASVALGYSTGATGNYAIAMGNHSLASANGTLAIGTQNTVSGEESMSLGNSNTNSAAQSFAVGNSNQILVGAHHALVLGSNSSASAPYGMAFGHSASASGEESIAIGLESTASGLRSAAVGYYSNAGGPEGIAIGSQVSATGFRSTALGFASESSGQDSRAIGTGVGSLSYGEIALGLWNTTYAISQSGQLFNNTDRLLSIGNGQNTSNRSDALVMLKNGNTRLHGNLTIDADNVNGAGEAYTLPGQDGAANQTLVTDGNGTVSWTNADISATNEIQDLTLNTTTNTLSISQDPTPATTVDLTPYRNVFETTNSVTSNENGDYANDDFVFGGADLNSNGSKFFFDKSKYAFRVGQAIDNSWSDTNIGANSFAAGFNVIASGTSSVAFGAGSQATGINSFATGQANQSHGYYSFSAGETNVVYGNNSVAIGRSSIITAAAPRSVALGGLNRIYGWGGVAIGNWLYSRSFSEIVFGHGSTDVTPISDIAWVPTDRLFVIGNGAPIGFSDLTQPPNRSDALVMLKNGNTRLHGQLTIDADNINGVGEAYTLPGQDGATNQTLVTDGNGTVSWQDATESILDRTTTIISNENGNYNTDSFVIGSPSLNDDGDANHDTRMFFEKSTGAFRAGTVEDFEWNAAERGLNSVAIGHRTIARGNYSVSLGLNNLAHSASSVAIGTNLLAEGYNSIALGRNVSTTGLHSMALAFYSTARSFGETTMGMFATDYVPNASQTFDGSDRLFTIGNGTAEGARSNALVIYKNGDATLLGTLTDASDVRLKRNIKPLQNSLLSLTNLTGVHYQWNGRKPQDTVALQTGLIAQEVEKIFPELVKTDEEGFKSVNYIGLVPHLIEAIKELKQENDLLKRENQLQKEDGTKKLESLEARLLAIESLLQKNSKVRSEK